jgi:transcriptional regulator with XRE-family HTH domain
LTTPTWLPAAAARSATETWTLGYALEQYRTKKHLPEEALAEELGCSVETLRCLCLCRRPEGPELAQQLHAIVQRFPASAKKLEEIIRETAG